MIQTISDLKKSDNFFLLAGPCVIEGEDMALRIAERVVKITDKLGIPYIFKGSYRKANRSRINKDYPNTQNRMTGFIPFDEDISSVLSKICR